jgi:hypothetical protein
VNEGESVDDAAHQCNGGRHETTRREDHSDEEYILGHTSSVVEDFAHVQAVVLMPHLRNLWEGMGHYRLVLTDDLCVPARENRNLRNS